MQNSEQYRFLIDDVQGIIRALDVKIGFIFVAVFVSFTQLKEIVDLIYKFVKFEGCVLMLLGGGIFISWLLVIGMTIFSLWPISRNFEPFNIGDESYEEFLKRDYERLFDVLDIKRKRASKALICFSVFIFFLLLGAIISNYVK